MSEYIVEVDDKVAEVFVKRFDWKAVTLYGHHLVGEIVRCRDCDYYDHWDASGPYREKHVCGQWDYLEINPNGFCAWGERKDENER